MRKYLRHPSDIPIDVQEQDRATASADRVVNVSQGGLSFYSAQAYAPGAVVCLRISLVQPPFETCSRVAWCRAHRGGYEVGVRFLESSDLFLARMVEQVCHIEHYRREVLAREGRALSSSDAALEWIAKYAADFPMAGGGTAAQ